MDSIVYFSFFSFSYFSLNLQHSQQQHVIHLSRHERYDTLSKKIYNIYTNIYKYKYLIYIRIYISIDFYQQQHQLLTSNSTRFWPAPAPDFDQQQHQLLTSHSTSFVHPVTFNPTPPKFLPWKYSTYKRIYIYIIE